MEKNEVYPLLALTALISVVISIGAFTLLNTRSSDCVWTETHAWKWERTNLDGWTTTITIKADFAYIKPGYIYRGDFSELGFMSVRVYPGRDTTEDTLMWWRDSGPYSGTSLPILGKGTYTLQVTTNYDTDAWLDVWEFASK